MKPGADLIAKNTSASFFKLHLTRRIKLNKKARDIRATSQAQYITLLPAVLKVYQFALAYAH